MGAWGMGIMDGDTPLDIRYEIFKIANVSEFTDDNEMSHPSTFKSEFEAAYDTIEAWCKSYTETWLGDNIAWLVFGVIIMDTGIEMKTTTFVSLDAACQDELRITINGEAGWGEENRVEREDILLKFWKSVITYYTEDVK